MSAGFGLRGASRPRRRIMDSSLADSEILKIVVLDCHPVFTSFIILSGCVVKTVIVGLVRELVGPGPGKAVEETWLAYSIP